MYNLSTYYVYNDDKNKQILYILILLFHLSTPLIRIV